MEAFQGTPFLVQLHSISLINLVNGKSCLFGVGLVVKYAILLMDVGEDLHGRWVEHLNQMPRRCNSIAHFLAFTFNSIDDVI